VSELRVEEAKRMLKDERCSEASVLTIGMDDGFKKLAGKTPSEYRKNFTSG
jgi:YesN/AraC family two-component response regulator